MAVGSVAALPLERGVKELETVDPVSLPAVQESSATLMFERLAKDPAVDVEKLQRLIDMQKDILAHNAESEFWAAFAEMQGKLPTIDEDGRIVVNGAVRSNYSTNEKLQETIRPILAEHGFSLSFRNRVTEKGARIVKGILAHRGGHKEYDEFESMPDDGGSMNSIQRIGSQRSYGQRYTSIALLNIVSRAKQDRDRDGVGSDTPKTPEGYEPWIAVLEGEAMGGLKTYEQAWQQSKPEYKTYCANHDRDRWNAIKATASAASKGRR